MLQLGRPDEARMWMSGFSLKEVSLTMKWRVLVTGIRLINKVLCAQKDTFVDKDKVNLPQLKSSDSSCLGIQRGHRKEAGRIRCFEFVLELQLIMLHRQFHLCGENKSGRCPARV